MVSSMRIACFAALVVLSAGVEVALLTQAEVTPVEKVVQLLKGLADEVAHETSKAKENYEEQACYCKDEKGRIEWLHSMATDKSAQLEAIIAEVEGRGTDANNGLTKALQGIKKTTAEIEAAEAAREIEHQHYLGNVSETVEAQNDIKGAIQALDAGTKKNMKGKVDFTLSELKSHVTQGAWSVLEQKDEEMKRALAQDEQAPAGYKFHSNDILAILDKLKDTYTDLKNQQDKQEFDRKVASDKEILALQIEKRSHEADKVEYEKKYVVLVERLNEMKKQKAKEDNDSRRYVEALKNLEQDCVDKAAKYDETMRLNQAEADALAKSEKMLEEQTLAVEAAASLAQTKKKSASFLQVRDADSSNTNAATQAKQKAAQKKAFAALSTAAHKLGSQSLMLTLFKARASKDHFIKVRDLIKNMLNRLESDALEEANQKTFCDAQMREHTDSRDTANAGIEAATGQLTSMNAQKDKLAAENSDKSGKIAEQTKALEELNKLHTQTHDNLVATKVAADIGRQSIGFAINTLSKVFESQGNAPAFLQTEERHKARMELRSNILSNLQVIEASFQRAMNEADDSLEEETLDFEKAEKKMEDMLHAMQTRVKENEGRIAELTDSITEQTDNLDTNQEQKDGALSTLAKLKVECVNNEETFEQRQEKAKEEIAALQNAYQILDQWQS